MQPDWPFWRRLLFRFFFIYFALTIAPWSWLDPAPKVGEWTSFITQYYWNGVSWAVTKSNEWFFHIRPVLVYPNGSGDTSYGWAELSFYLLVSFTGMLIWSLADRRRTNYTKLNYWLCLFVRYYVAMVLFLYGILKLFSLQMAFPSYSQLATPLGDFLPMRLSWMFLGYSTPYQFFSGLMETLAAVLLLYRRTATLGALLATAVFLNVAVLNLSYDIPVKIYSIQLVVCCFFLLANESRRILCFFIYNRPAEACTVYQFSFQKKWMRASRVLLKSLFILLAVGNVLWDSFEHKKEKDKEQSNMVFAPGLYNVSEFIMNRDTLSGTNGDSLRWRDFAFDSNHGGSVSSEDTCFYTYYHRGYFQYKIDTLERFIRIFKTRRDNIPFALFHYQIADDGSILFRGKRNNDSINFTLRRNLHHYQLPERQFHWLSEENR
jgi:hypothetical protein